MLARCLVGQHMRQEDALIDLVALFVLERERRFGGQFLFTGDEARHEFGGIEHQLLGADEFRPVAGQFTVDGFNVSSEVALPLLACAIMDHSGRDFLPCVAVAFRR